MLVRCDENNNRYLYDLVRIRKTSKPHLQKLYDCKLRF